MQTEPFFFRRLSQQILQHGTLRAFCKVEVEFINWVFPLSKPKKPANHEDIFFAYGLLNSDSLEGSCRLNTHSPTFQFPHPDARTWVRARCSSVQCVQGAKMTSQEFPFHDRTFSNPDTWTERFQTTPLSHVLGAVYMQTNATYSPILGRLPPLTFRLPPHLGVGALHRASVAELTASCV